MNTSFESRIAQVIKQRQAITHRVQPVHQYLDELCNQISQLNHKRDGLLQDVSQTTVKERLTQLDLEGIKAQIATQNSQLQKLMERFSRPTLNIGVVGRMGQGKSTFLQSLSGLKDSEIPAKKGAACTAARSKIRHHEGETEAVVLFHSEQSFLSEVLAPYYQKLGLGPCPTSLEEFGNRPLPESPNSIALKVMYTHLKDDYHTGFHRYRELLKAGEPWEQKIKKSEIPIYVSQNRDDDSQLTDVRHLAVKEVEIFCEFKRQGIGHLGLVDVPGLGDTRLGDETLLLKTLGREIDVVLFLRRPDAWRYQWQPEDAALYDVAAAALPDLADRAFILINHQPSVEGHLEACESLEKSMGDLRSVSRSIVDCQNADAANRVLDQILDYLENNVVQIEERYAQTCQQSVMDLHEQIAAELNRAEIDERIDSLELREFRPAFEILMQNISTAMGGMVNTLSAQMQQEDSDFQSAVQEAIQDCGAIAIPSEAEIEERRLTPECKGSYSRTFLGCIAELRVELSKSFLGLDEGLQQAADKLKFQATQILIEQGQLGTLVSASEVNTFLEEMTTLLTQQDNRLALGFGTLSQFSISYGALIHRLIRQKLMELLDPDVIAHRAELAGASAQAASALGTAATQIAIEVTPAPSVANTAAHVVNSAADLIATANTELDGATVHQQLETHHQAAVSACQEILERWVVVPNQIRYYMAREFVDLILYDQNVEAEWEKFLWSSRDKVWPAFRQFQQIQDAIASWDQATKQLQYLNQRHRFKFIN